MRPIVIEKDEFGNIKITVDEIKKIVDKAYDAGYEDGKKFNPITITTPYYPYQPSLTPTWVSDHTEITCTSMPEQFLKIM